MSLEGFVPEVGLEPTRLSSGDFKSPMSTISSLGHLRSRAESDRRIRVLQTLALPLGD